MRVEIRPRGLTLTRKQTLELQHELRTVFARFGDRIVRVTATASPSPTGDLIACELKVHVAPKPVTVMCSDRDVLVAAGYAARRAARSVSRAIDLEDLTHR